MGVAIAAVATVPIFATRGGDLAYDFIHQTGVITAAFVLVYFVAILVTRWFLIAAPIRAQCRARTSELKTEMEALSLGGPEATAAMQLLDEVTELLSLSGEGRRARRPAWVARDWLVWGRGVEVEALDRLDAAQRLVAMSLPEEQVRARLVVVRASLQRLKGPQAVALGTVIDKALEAGAARPESTPKLRGALLAEALHELHRESRIKRDLDWQRKGLWLAFSGLVMIIVLAAALGRPEIFLVGAVGAFLSRLYRGLRAADTPAAYWSNWVPLMLGPIAGALAAYGGILLIELLRDFDLLGTALDDVSWDHPRRAATLAVAFLFGFSERLLDRIVEQAEERVLHPAAEVAGEAGATPTTQEVIDGEGGLAGEGEQAEEAVAEEAAVAAPAAVPEDIDANVADILAAPDDVAAREIEAALIEQTDNRPRDVDGEVPGAEADEDDGAEEDDDGDSDSEDPK